MQSPMINVGAVVSKETSENAANAVVAVLQAGFDTHSSDKVMLKAFETLRASMHVGSVNITNSHFKSDTSKKVEIIIPDDYETVAKLNDQ